jgi:hypothetical protein
MKKYTKLLIIALIIVSIAIALCIVLGSSFDLGYFDISERITETYGAEIFHQQLTAIAEETPSPTP